MQKVSNFLAQIKKNTKCQLGHFCPYPIYDENLQFTLPYL